MCAMSSILIRLPLFIVFLIFLLMRWDLLLDLSNEGSVSKLYCLIAIFLLIYLIAQIDVLKDYYPSQILAIKYYIAKFGLFAEFIIIALHAFSGYWFIPHLLAAVYFYYLTRNIEKEIQTAQG